MKIKLILFCVFFLGLFEQTLAQNYFSKMYDLFGGWEAANNLIEYDSISRTIVISGTTVDFNASDSSKYRQSFIWLLDSLGNYKLKSLFSDSPMNMIGFLPLKTKSSVILIAESQQVDSPFTFNKLYYINKKGEIINSLNVEYPKRFNSIKYIIRNNLIYSYGTNVLTGSWWPFATLCFDTLGKQLWYKVYNDKLVFPTGVAIASDGSFLVGGVQTKKGDISKGERDSLNPFFAKMDTLGNFIWEKKIPNNPNLSVSNISPIEINGTYYWFGGYPSSQKDLSKLAYSYLIKTNTSGDVILNKKIIEGKSAENDYMVCHLGYPLLKNNFIYMLGQASDTISYFKYNDYIQLCKLDTQGNIKWRRTFSQWYMSNRPYSLTAIPDGFIICADGKDTTHTTGYTDAWIIKTDTNGCIIPGCHLADAVIEVVDERNYVKVYPNPANTQVTIEFSDPLHTQIDWIELLDANGLSLQSKTVNNQTYTLNTAQLSNGLYYIAAYFKGNKRVVKKVLVQH
jgi:hypothetical protein